MNYYEILGLKKNASQKEIRDAYKKLIKKYHPDLYPGDKKFAEKKAQSINAAYDVLSNLETKKAYDEEINPSYQYNTSSTTTTYNYTNPNQNTSSSYSYENYKKNTSSNNDFYQRRYSDFHRSKTPNSNYTSYNNNSIFDRFFKTTNQKILAISVVVLLYFILLFSNIANFKTYMDKSTSTTNSSSMPKSIPSDYDYYDGDNQTEFNINDYYTDKELYEVYEKYYKDSFDSFAEFKKAFSEFLEYYYSDDN